MAQTSASTKLTFAVFILATSLTGGAALAASAEVPIDKGPDTPAANQAYQGGGVILQGSPGAPAPKPEPTPPGQTPRGMVNTPQTN